MSTTISNPFTTGTTESLTCSWHWAVTCRLRPDGLPVSQGWLSSIHTHTHTLLQRTGGAPGALKSILQCPHHTREESPKEATRAAATCHPPGAKWWAEPLDDVALADDVVALAEDAVTLLGAGVMEVSVVDVPRGTVTTAVSVAPGSAVIYMRSTSNSDENGEFQSSYPTGLP